MNLYNKEHTVSSEAYRSNYEKIRWNNNNHKEDLCQKSSQSTKCAGCAKEKNK